MTPYKDFTARLKLLISKNPQLITTTLSNIFTMRLIGNKTHGDLAEIAMAEFINQCMYDFTSVHVGKDLYRAKSHEEDIKIINEITKAEFPVSLKAYGDGPLQLSTDKHSVMFPRLLQEQGNIEDPKKLQAVFDDPAFAAFSNVNVLPLIYDEKKQQCNILVFDYETARNQTARIVHKTVGKGRKHPVFKFYDAEGDYICEVRYGDAAANALQRGFWTHTRNALKHFESVTDGWIIYAHNPLLVTLFSHALLSTSQGHAEALERLKADVEAQKAGGEYPMNHLSLFDDMVLDAPQTEGIKYTGSKLKLLPHILDLVRKTGAKTVIDGFAGTTRVSQALAQSGYRVTSCDISAWSSTFATCYLLNTYPQSHYLPLVEHLNSLPGIDGWFTENYGGDPNAGSSIGADRLKKPWQKHNTRRLDAIRQEIEALCLSEIEKSVLITSLVLALDAVDNTLGHFASYLNEWSARSYKILQLRVPKLLLKCQDHQVHQGDIFDTLLQVSADVAYLDPPYGSNNEKMPPSRVRYSAYYHLWTTVCLNDKPPLFGKVKRRCDSSDDVSGSVFEEFRKDEAGHYLAVKAIHALLCQTNAEHLILSYSSGGRATAKELNDCIADVGRTLEVVEIDYRRNVMAEMRSTRNWVNDAEAPNREFLFLIEKTAAKRRNSS